MSEKQDKVKVWDLFVRTGHWTLVTAFTLAYVTEDELMAVHSWAGYAVGTILILRIIWGFMGSRYARFTDFVYPPSVSFRYLWNMIVRQQGARYLGHSPAGGAMVVLLLVSLSATVWSGMVVYAIDENAGPLAGYVSNGSANAETLNDLVAQARADDDEDDGHEDESREDYWEELHELAANLSVLLVFLHIAGVILASVVHRENLVLSMLHGYKSKHS